MKLSQTSSEPVRYETMKWKEARTSESPEIQSSATVRQAEKELVKKLLKTQRVIRRVDFFSALCVMITLALAILFVGTLFDSWLLSTGLSTKGRFSFAVFWITVSLLSFIWRLIPVLKRRVNPLYAAKMLETTQEDSHNLTINWLQLCRYANHDNEEIERMYTKEGEAVRHAVLENVTLQAARQSKASQIETTVDCSSLIRWGITLASLVSILAIYLVLSPKNPFVSALRIVAPLAEIERPQALRFAEVIPGNTTVYYGDNLDVNASIHGSRSAEKVELLWSTEDGRLTDVPILLTPNGPSHFNGRFPDNEEGFTENLSYRIVANRGGQFESSSEVFKVEVKAQPSFRIEKTTLRFPTYTGLAPQTFISQGDVRAVENTVIEIEARASDRLSRAFMLPDGDSTRAIEMTISQDEPDLASLSFQLAWNKDKDENRRPAFSSYTLLSEDVNGEKNRDAQVYTVSILPDLPPTINWEDENASPVEIPLNDTLSVRFTAEDADYALRHVRLHLAHSAVNQGGKIEVADPAPIELPLTSGFQTTLQSDGPTPVVGKQTLSYTLIPEKKGLRIGDEIEYWGVAIDSKLPNPNVSETDKRVFIIVDPVANPNHQNSTSESLDSQEQDSTNNSESDSSNNNSSSSSGNGSENESEENNNKSSDENGNQGDNNNSSETTKDSGNESDSTESKKGSEKSEGTNQSNDGSEKDAQNENHSNGESGSETSNDENHQSESSLESEGGTSNKSEKTNDSQEGSDGDSFSSSDSGLNQENLSSRNGEEGLQQPSSTVSQNQNQTGMESKNPFQTILDFMNEQESSKNNGHEANSGIKNDDPTSQTLPDARGDKTKTDVKDGESLNESDKNVDPDFQTEEDIPSSEEKRNLPTRSSTEKPSSESQSYQANSPEVLDPNISRRKGDVDANSNDFLGQNADPNTTETVPNNHKNPNITLDPLNQGEGVAADSTHPEAPEAHGGAIPPSGSPSEIDENTDASQRPQISDSPQEQNGRSPNGAGGAANSSENKGSENRSDVNPDTENGTSSPDKKNSHQNNATSPSGGDSNSSGKTHGGGGAGTGQGEIEPSDEQLAPADSPKLQYTEKATNLVLEYLEDSLKNKVDKRLLNNLGMTEAELREFVKEWQRLRDQAQKGNKKALNDYLHALEKLSLGADEQIGTSETTDVTRERNPETQSRRSEGSEGSRTKTPDRLSERVRAFTRGVSKGVNLQ